MPTTISNQVIDCIPAQGSQKRLGFLDGLRGLAALYVVMHHFSLIAIWLTTDGDWSGGFAQTFKKSIVWSHFLLFQYGHYAVDMFIVLSGYCLMLPVVRNGTGYLSGGALNYLHRRAQRILPPYYGALILSLLILRLVPGLQNVRLSYFHWAFPALQPASILSHMFLLHDLIPGFALRINPPMWSVAVEWHIYFLFPLILLPLYRRLPIGLVVVCAFVLGLIPHYVFHCLDQASPWFFGLFTLGMFGAVICLSQQRIEEAWFKNLPWGIMSICSGSIFVGLNFLQRKSFLDTPWLRWSRFDTWGTQWPMDLLVGIITTCFIVYCFRLSKGGSRTSTLLKFLQGKIPINLGIFSYSLYLTHSIVLQLAVLVTQRLNLAMPTACLVILGIGFPMALGLAYLFHLLFERPFLPAHYRGLLHKNDNV